ncbi:histidine kinase [Agromyces silvae]|uniref:histidine kinase n=1 Tax=Agromyces silvae TaxID=3388266 RepID=UPI00280A9596|nr:histidine kinase [Agromyces protaetiae]
MNVDDQDHARDDSPSVIRMRRLAMITAVAAIAPLSIVGVALTASTWWDGLIISLSFLLTLGLLREWSLDGYPRRALLALGITAAAWIMGALGVSSPLSFLPVALVGALLLARTRRRMVWIPVFAFGVAAVGAGAFVFNEASGELAAAYLLTPFVGTLFISGVVLISEQVWLVARRLERAQDAEAQLAVASERVRFAGDLHDIQGHSLHVIKLKAALAGRLVRVEPERAEQELGEIRRLADEAITETRALAYARIELNLSAELENAKRLCEAAGFAVDARFDPGSGAHPHPLLAQVLREATTNLLRHAHPTTVTITASPIMVEVVNDGAHSGADNPLRGLARLRERVEEAGGSLHFGHASGRFTVLVELDPVNGREEARRDD